MTPTARERLNGPPLMTKVVDEDFVGMSLSSLHPGNRWFDRCDFSGADLRLATLDGCFFRFCRFVGANLSGASVRGATFAGCDLTDADLSNSDLTDSTLTFVNTGTPSGLTVLTGANLRNATLGGVQAERVVVGPLISHSQ
jgi:uncharacterized protein YjbI with pentapeptide repeats